MSYDNTPLECELDPVFGACRRTDNHACSCKPAEQPPEVQAPDELRAACDELLRTIQELELCGSDKQLDEFEAAESKLRDIMAARVRSRA